MSCEATRERYHDLIDGELGPEKERELRDHLEACPACREACEALAAVVDVVREIPAPEAPADLADAVLARLPGRSRFGRILWLAPLAAAAGLILIVSLASHRPPAPGAEPGVTETARVRDRAQDPSPTGSSEWEKNALDADRSEPAPVTSPRPVDTLEEKLGAGRLEERSGPASEAGGPGSGDAPASKVAPAPPAGPGATVAAGRAAVPGRAGSSGGKAASAEKKGGTASTIPTEEIHVRGEDPDTVAGVLLAELGNFRSRSPIGGSGAGLVVRPESRRACREEVRADRRGEIRTLVLCVTPEEFRFVRTFLTARSGRTDGERGTAAGPAAPAAPPADAGAEEAGAGNGESADDDGSDEARRRVVIRFDG